MRFYRKGSITLSEDDATTPKQIRFEDREHETAETTIIQEGGGHTQVIEKNVTDFNIPLGKVAQGKWFYFFCDQPFRIKINNGADLVMAADKVNEMWVDFTSLKVTNPSGTDDMRLTWAIGGA